MIAKSYLEFSFCLQIGHSRFGWGEYKLVMPREPESVVGPRMIVLSGGQYRYFDLPDVYHFTNRGESVEQKVFYVPGDKVRSVGWFDEFGSRIFLRFWHYELDPPPSSQ